jgi:hypothetical protein
LPLLLVLLLVLLPLPLPLPLLLLLVLLLVLLVVLLLVKLGLMDSTGFAVWLLGLGQLDLLCSGWSQLEQLCIDGTVLVLAVTLVQLNLCTLNPKLFLKLLPHEQSCGV